MAPTQPPYRESQTGVELALQAIQGSLEGYKTSVDQGIRDVRQDLKDHTKDERDWQEKIETQLLLMAAVPEKVEEMRKKLDTSGIFQLPDKVRDVTAKLDAHEVVFQQAKGAILASKILWGVAGGLVVLASWLVAQVGLTPRLVAAKDGSPHEQSHVSMPANISVSSPVPAHSVPLPRP